MSSKTSPSCSCIICHNEYSNKGIFTHHERTHLKSLKFTSNKNGICHSNVRIKNEQKYLINPSLCIQCGETLPYSKKDNKFCSKSCSAKFSNSKREKISKSNQLPLNKGKSKKCLVSYCVICNRTIPNKIRKTCSDECLKQFKINTSAITNSKISNTLLSKYNKPIIKHNKRKVKKVIMSYVGEYSKIFRCNCKSCKTKFFDLSAKQYCKYCRVNMTNKKSIYQFKFNVYDYPNLFNLELLNQIGFYAPKGKSGKWNPNGLSRDHKVSVSEACKFDYDPYYMTHPINCDLMPHTDNLKKFTSSSLSYARLIELVNEYDSKLI